MVEHHNNVIQSIIAFQALATRCVGQAHSAIIVAVTPRIAPTVVVCHGMQWQHPTRTLNARRIVVNAGQTERTPWRGPLPLALHRANARAPKRARHNEISKTNMATHRARAQRMHNNCRSARLAFAANYTHRP